jgi:hypothetical protein
MNLRVPMAAGLTALTLLGSGVAASTPAQASAKNSTNCSAWISGAWGHGRCTRTSSGSFPMRLDVYCDAWWDADVHLRATVPGYGTYELQGHCASSVVGVSAYWG